MYKNGQGVKQDHAEAVRWNRKAAEQGHAGAQCNLGVMYAYGQGVKQGHAEAVRWYRKAAEQGDAGGQFNLGVVYDNGQGVKLGDAEAVRWYRKAAERAVRWYRKAAEQGVAGGQFNLGVAYENGRGVKQDHAEAVRLNRKAAEQGLVNAVSALKRLSAGPVTSNASPSTPKVIAPSTGRLCSNCGIGERGGGAALKPCSRFKVALYCGRECQVQHWKAGGHKAVCKA